MVTGSVGECLSADEVEGPWESLEAWPELAPESALVCPETCRCCLGHSGEVSSALVDTTKTSQLQGPSNGLFPCLCAPAVQQFFLNASPCLCCCRWHLRLAQRGDSPPQESDRLHTTETAKENRANVVFLISGGQELRQQRHFSRTAEPLGSLPCKIFSGGT